jgi:hypothetical protein
MFTTYTVDANPELNPLVGSSLYETALNCASALRWVYAIDVERLSDKAVEDGLYTIINPILAALECSADREADCITLSAGDSKRLRALAGESHQGCIAEALNNAIDCAEITAEREAEERAAADPETMRRVWTDVAAKAAEELAKLDRGGESEQGEALHLELTDQELSHLRAVAEQEGADLPQIAARLLAGALRHHASVVGGAA